MYQKTPIEGVVPPERDEGDTYMYAPHSRPTPTWMGSDPHGMSRRLRLADSELTSGRMGTDVEAPQEAGALEESPDAVLSLPCRLGISEEVLLRAAANCSVDSDLDVLSAPDQCLNPGHHLREDVLSADRGLLGQAEHRDLLRVGPELADQAIDRPLEGFDSRVTVRAHLVVPIRWVST